MIRIHFQRAAILLAIQLSFSFFPSFAQSGVDPDILKWEHDIALIDSLNDVEFADAGTLLVSGSSSIRMWDSIHTDLAPFRVIQRGYGGAKLSDYNYYAGRIIKP